MSDEYANIALQERLNTAEKLIDKAITNGANYISAMVSSREELGASVDVGQTALEEAIRSLEHLATARRSIIEANGNLEKMIEISERINLADLATQKSEPTQDPTIARLFLKRDS